MTVDVKEFIEKTKLPSFLSENKVLKSFDKVHKVFPGIGLPNCSEDIVIDNSAVVSASTTSLLQAFIDILGQAEVDLNRSASNKKFSQQKVTSIKNYINSLGKVCNVLAFCQRTIIRKDDAGKISLKLDENILDEKENVLFKKDESIFRIYNKIYKHIINMKCGVRIERLDSMPEFKRFSSDNLPTNKFQIVFSSDGVDGLWDIATMSQRGIESCQSWDGQYKNNLVGSIVDPFVGIIYITSGSKYNQFGTKMVKRCVVRFLVNSESKERLIVLDQMYPTYDKLITDQFIDFIKRRVNENISVSYAPMSMYKLTTKVYIPYSDVHKKLTESTKSYRDTKFLYKCELPVETTKLNKNIDSKLSKFRNILRNTSFKESNHLNSSVDNDESIDIIIKSVDFKHLVREYYLNIAEVMIESGPKKENFTSSKDFFRRMIFFYIKERNNQTKNITTSFVKKINKYFDTTIPTKVTSKAIIKVLEPVQKSIDTNLKEELKKLLEKKTTIAKLPN